MAELTEEDRELLRELGLSGAKSVKECDTLIESFRLRQLDRLKIMLSRFAKGGHFSQEISEGIRKNDTTAFSRAVISLTDKSLENAN